MILHFHQRSILVNLLARYLTCFLCLQFFGWIVFYITIYKEMGASCPHGLEAKIIHWWTLWNVRSHEQSVPKFGAKTDLIGPLLPEQEETVEVPQNRRFCFDVCSSSPRAHLYRWKCPSIWAKSEVLTWRTCGGTRCELGEHFGNPLGTSREHRGNTLGNRENWRKKKFFPLHP